MSVVPFSTPAVRAENPLPGFTSFKCSAPILYTRRSCRDALIQATLDADINAIEPLSPSAYRFGDAYFGFVAVVSGRRCAVILTEHDESPPRPPDGCQVAISLSRSNLLCDPVKTVSRMIWAHRDIPLPAGFVVRVMHRLHLAPDGMRLAELEDDLLDEPKRWVEFILTMVCSGLVTIDYRAHVTGRSLIRPRPDFDDRQLTMRWFDRVNTVPV